MIYTSMTSEMEAVRKGSKINRAAKLHGLPCTTLKEPFEWKSQTCIDQDQSHMLMTRRSMPS